MIWKNIEYNKYPEIIMSDCKVNKIQIEENQVILNFSEDGFFVKDSKKQGYYRTDAAQVVLQASNIDDISIKEVRTNQLSDKVCFDSMYDVEVQDFVENINTGKWSLEIVEEYYSAMGALYSLWIKSTGTSFWCYIKLGFQNMVYKWNEIRYEYPL